MVPIFELANMSKIHKPRIVYVTCCNNGLFGLRHLHRTGFCIERVITIGPNLGERYGVSGYVDPSKWCESAGISVTVLNDYTLRREDIDDTSKEILVVNGWNRLIAGDVIVKFEFGALGVHAGHPPIGLGRAPLPWNIIKGFSDLEVYVFRLTENADDGDIMAIEAVEITPHDDVRTLYEKVMFRAAQMFEDAIIALMDGKRGFRQAKELQVIYPKRLPTDGLIDFRLSVGELTDFIRAQTHPYPGAFCFLNGTKWSIWSAQSFDAFAFRDEPRIPGRIVLALPSGIVVQTGSTPLWITSATIDGLVTVPAALEELEEYVGNVFAPAAC